MSDANDSTTVSDANPVPEHEPHIKVLKGNPSAEELAALIGVLSAAGGGPVDTTPAAVDLWGHPVDRLRYTVHSWQRITLLERQHMRR
ncbi:MAG: acyl-CoA carboxylase subunit epsilon [Mycolicibacterium cosmeticum]|nr:acyl-CoA carboxylase subunit epsilon [Mycolicibacterium cosmeticum]